MKRGASVTGWILIAVALAVPGLYLMARQYGRADFFSRRNAACDVYEFAVRFRGDFDVRGVRL